MPPEPVRIPLADWADTWLAELARTTGSAAIAALDGATLLGERAARNGFRIPGEKSAGGGCRMFAAADGTIALNLARPDDRTLLPALFGSDWVDFAEDVAIAGAAKGKPAAVLVERGRVLGLAIARLDETPASPAATVSATGKRRDRTGRPLVIDLSALWAGPLAAHLLWLGGAEVIKVESLDRPDSMREGDPALFALLNQGKANVALDLRDNGDCAALLALIRRADAVIEAARPRALLQLGIDADALVREVPGLAWVTITGHGAKGDAANWIGFGDDTGVAGGLSRALLEETGTLGFVGDAIGDPLTGIYAAMIAQNAMTAGWSERSIVSMSGVVAAALAGQRASAPQELARSLQAWAGSAGQPFPPVAQRPTAPPAALGANNARLLN